MNSKKYSVVDATLTSTYSIVYRNDKGLRIVNSENVTVFTMWDRNPITVLTASDNVCNDISELFPEAVYKYTNNYGNKHHLFRIPNISVDDVLTGVLIRTPVNLIRVKEIRLLVITNQTICLKDLALRL